MTVRPDEELRPQRKAPFHDGFPMRHDIAGGGRPQLLDRGRRRVGVAPHVVESVFPVDRDPRLAQPLFQRVLKDILRQDHHEGECSAKLGKLHLGLTRGAIVERDLLDASSAFDHRGRQPHLVQEPEGPRVQGAGITAHRRAFLAVDDSYLDARLSQQDSGQQTHWPRPNHQDFRSLFSHTLPFCVCAFL